MNLLLLILILFLPSTSTAQFIGAKDIKITCNRWFDTTSLKAFGQSAIKIMEAKTNEEKAIAVWRAIQQTTVATNKVPSEPAYHIKYIQNPIKLLNVYGGHWCDGLSRIMIMTWRALGYRAEKLYKWGHTLADCWWEDKDGVARWHLFDLSQHWFVYSRDGNHIATPEEIALDLSLIYRPSRTPIPDYPSGYGMWSYVHCQHLPWPTHNMLLNLKQNETLIRLWGNKGLPYQDIFTKYKKNTKDFKHGPYPLTYGNGELIYYPDLSSKAFIKNLHFVQNLDYKDNKPYLHPAKIKKRGIAIIKIQTPYIIADACITSRLYRKTRQDKVSFFISTDGHNWQRIWVAKDTGWINFKRKLPITFGHYEYFLKIVLKSHQTITDCGIEKLIINTITQHNIHSLPQLWPGENTITVYGNISPQTTLEVTYVWDDLTGKNKKHTVFVKNTPFSYTITTSGKKWDDVVCKALIIRAIPKINNNNQIVYASFGKKIKDLTPKSIPTNKFIGRQSSPKLKKPSKCIKIIKKNLVRQKKPCSKEELRQIKNNIRHALLDLMVLRPIQAKETIKKVIFEDISGNNILASQALYIIAGEEAVPTLIKILKKDPAIRWDTVSNWLHTSAMAAFILAQINNSRAKKAAFLVADFLDNKKLAQKIGQNPRKIYRFTDLRWVWIKALGKLGTPYHSSILKREIFSPDVDGAALAIKALGEIGDRSAIPDLLQVLKTHNWPPQGIYAIEALGKLGDKNLASVLYPYLNHWDEDYRGATAIALGRLKNPEALPYLKAILNKEPFPWVKKEIIKTFQCY